jgi:phage gpG-like protein
VVSLSLSVNGTQQLQRTLRRWIDTATDIRPALEEVADRFVRMELQQFLSQGGSGGAGWAPLSPRYAARKARTHPGAPILVRSGDLRRDLTHRPMGVERITNEGMTMGTALPYARYHQTGTPRMPRRPPVNLTEAQRQELVKIVQRYLVSHSGPRAR